MPKQIALTQNQFAIVDDEDYERVSRFKWCALRQRNGYYAVRGEWFKRKTVLQGMHRFVLDAPKGSWVDHINGNTLDNRKSNLRLVTPMQSAQNRKVQSNNSSKYKGVHWHRRDKKWQVFITVNRKQIHLGNFDSPEDAARAYDAAAIRYHGEFAKLNFPKENKQ